MKNKTLILGASENPERYSYLALKKLRAGGHQVVALGRKSGKVDDVEIISQPVNDPDIDTITLYMNPTHQRPYYDYLLSLKPRRIIFNPGTENDELWDLAQSADIQTINACTLVMLASGQY